MTYIVDLELVERVLPQTAKLLVKEEMMAYMNTTGRLSLKLSWEALPCLSCSQVMVVEELLSGLEAYSATKGHGSLFLLDFLDDQDRYRPDWPSRVVGICELLHRLETDGVGYEIYETIVERIMAAMPEIDGQLHHLVRLEVLAHVLLILVTEYQRTENDLQPFIELIDRLWTWVRYRGYSEAVAVHMFRRGEPFAFVALVLFAYEMKTQVQDDVIWGLGPDVVGTPLLSTEEVLKLQPSPVSSPAESPVSVRFSPTPEGSQEDVEIDAQVLVIISDDDESPERSEGMDNGEEAE